MLRLLFPDPENHFVKPYFWFPVSIGLYFVEFCTNFFITLFLQNILFSCDQVKCNDSFGIAIHISLHNIHHYLSLGHISSWIYSSSYNKVLFSLHCLCILSTRYSVMWTVLVSSLLTIFHYTKM